MFALGAIFYLPKSIKFMAIHESQRRKMEALLKEMRPDFSVPPNARFVIEDEKQSPSNPLNLFREGLALITPLTWLIFACNLMGYFFLLSWTPTLMGAAHGAADRRAGRRRTPGRRHGRFAAAVLVAAAVAVSRHRHHVRDRRADRRRDRLCRIESTAALLVVTFFAGFIVLGIQSGINVVGAMIYPTSLRANGSGWQLGIGRLGAIAGPLVGAMFVGLPYPAPLHVRGDSIRARRSRDLHRLRAQQRAAEGASGTCKGAITIVIPGLRPVAASRKGVRTARTLVTPESPSRRTGGSNASGPPQAGRRN